MREKPIIRPRPWRGVKTKTAVFLPFDLPSKVLRKALLASKTREISRPYVHAYLTHDRIVVYGAVGAPLTGICMEELIASGVRDFLVLGISGSLSAEYRLGAAVSVTKAFSEEGTSRMYFSKKKTFFPEPALKRSIHSSLTARGLPYQRGVIVTTDGPFRETPSWLERNRRRGAGLVDMETSTVFALAEHHRRRAAALMIVSDELHSGTWKPGFEDPVFEHSVAAYFSLFLK